MFSMAVAHKTSYDYIIKGAGGALPPIKNDEKSHNHFCDKAPLPKYDREKFMRRFVNLSPQFLVGAKTLSIMTLSIMTFSIMT